MLQSRDEYRKVKCSDRLPDKSDWYDTSLGQIYFYADHKRWGKAHYNKYPIYWLEPLKLPTEEEIIENVPYKEDDISMYQNGKNIGFVLGARWVLSQINKY